MKKKYIRISQGFAILLVICSVLYLSGYRFTSLDAARAHLDVGKNSVPFEDVDFGWGKIYLFKTPKGPQTTIAIKNKFLWKASTSVYDDQSSQDMINTVGWMSYHDKRGQATIFAVETLDPNIAYVEVGPSNERFKKEITVNIPIIYSWNKAFQLTELRPLAFSKDGTLLYEYRYPENIRGEGLKWYSVSGNT